MGFTKAVQACLTKYIVFQGRAARSEYWYFILFLAILRIASMVGDFAIFGSFGLPGFRLITSLVFLLPQLAVTVRRLHDTGHSGWLVLILTVLATADLLIFRYYTAASSSIIVNLAMDAIVLASAILFIIQFVLFVSAGTEGENKYGPDPLARHPTQPS